VPAGRRAHLRTTGTTGTISTTRTTGTTRLPRTLHPGAWWLWALGLAAAASRTDNPVLLLLIAAVAGYVVAARRSRASCSRAYAVFVRLGLAVLVIRVGLFVLFNPGGGGPVILPLPQVTLPGWLSSVSLGGSITAGGLADAAYNGLQLAVLLICVGAANALASPTRLLRALPGALYEVGVAVTVALTFAPQTVVAIGRVREARRLRGRADRGLRGLRGMAMPVLESALERSVDLAAAMDSRGFGRRAGVPAGQRRVTAFAVVGGLLALCGSMYGLLDAAAPAALGTPLLGAGAALSAAGLLLGSRRTRRTRYRPDRWRLPELVVAGSGAVAAAGLSVAAGAAALHPATAPPVLPPVPALGVLCLLAGLAPAVVAPPPEPGRPGAGRPGPGRRRDGRRAGSSPGRRITAGPVPVPGQSEKPSGVAVA
jgi:energy-coupling factor transport system permease protein